MAGPDELRDSRMVVELEWRSDLLDAAIVHHDDAIGHRHRLDLIVRDIDRRRLQSLMECLNLGAHRNRRSAGAIWKRGGMREDSEYREPWPRRRDQRSH